MKTYQDLVAEARTNIRLVLLDQADGAVAQAEILIDVREESEYAASHLPGAVHMSRGVLEGRIASVPAGKKADSKILLYCRTDARASLAAVSLQGMGYTDVQVLAGGFDAWIGAGKPVYGN